MKAPQSFLSLLLVVVLAGGMFFSASSALAAPITISSTFHFRDIRGPNSVNFFVGDRLVPGVAAPEPAAEDQQD